MKVFLALIFLQFQTVSATETCIEKVRDNMCRYLESRRDEAIFKDSNGDEVLNPYHENAAEARIPQELPHTTFRNLEKLSYEETVDLNDLQVEYEAGVDSLFEQPKVKALPERTKRYLRNGLNSSNSNFYIGGEAGAESNETKFQIPVPLDQQNAPLRDLTQGELAELLKSVAPDFIQNFTGAQKAYQNKMKEVADKNAEIIAKRAALQTNLVFPFNLNETEKDALRDRVNKTFKFAKDSVIELLKRGQADDQLSHEQKKLILKIEQIKMVDIFDPKILNHPQCVQAQNNDAFFLNGSLSIMVCPGELLRVSTPHLIKILGHEIGHAVDPCRVSTNLYRYDGQKLQELFENKKLSEEDYKTLKNVYEGSAIVSVEEWTKKYEQFLIEHKVFLPLQDGVRPDKHPFKDVISCVEKEKYFDDVDNQDIDYVVKRRADASRRLGYNLSKSELKTLRHEAEGVRYCAPFLYKHTQMTEGMADFFGNYAEKEWMKKNPPKNYIDVASRLSFISGRPFCATANAPSYVGLTKPEDMLSELHPEHRHRYQFLIQTPGVQESFGCAAEEKLKCVEVIRKKSDSVVQKIQLPVVPPRPAMKALEDKSESSGVQN